jgi:hypothetical protein
VRRGPVVASAVGVGVAARAAVLVRRRRVGAPPMLGPWTGRLAIWVPARPRSPRSRWVARVWAAPMTLVGLLVGAGSGARPRVRDGVVVFAPAGALTGWTVQVRGFAGAAFGHVIVSVDEPSPSMWAHELVHVRQAEVFGPLMAPLYLWLLARHGYRDHPMEMAARLGAGQISRSG